MSKPNTKINVSGKSIERNDLPQLLSDSDEDIAAFVDALFDACVRQDLDEDEAMQVLDASLETGDVVTEKPRIDLSGFYADDSPHFYCDKNLPEEEVNRLCDEFFEEVERGEKSLIMEAIKQADAIMALEGFKKTKLAIKTDEAVLAGQVTFKQVADEMVEYAKIHKKLDGFLESRMWIKDKTGEKTGV